MEYPIMLNWKQPCNFATNFITFRVCPPVDI